MKAAAATPSKKPHSARAQACRRLVRRQALKAAGVSALPVLGADLVVNGQLLVLTIERINLAYGLSPEQIAELPPAQRTRVDELASKVGTYLIGRAVTQGAIVAALRALGVRIGAQQAAKLAPAVGIVASAALSGWMFMRLCERHIAHCEQVRAELQMLAGPSHDVIDI